MLENQAKMNIVDALGETASKLRKLADITETYYSIARQKGDIPKSINVHDARLALADLQDTVREWVDAEWKLMQRVDEYQEITHEKETQEEK